MEPPRAARCPCRKGGRPPREPARGEPARRRVRHRRGGRGIRQGAPHRGTGPAMAEEWPGVRRGRVVVAPPAGARGPRRGAVAGARRGHRAEELRVLRLCARVGRPGCGAPAAAGVEVGRRGGSGGTSRGVGGVAPAAASARGRSGAGRCRLAGRPASSRSDGAEGGSCAGRGKAGAGVAAGSPRDVRCRARKLRRSFPARAPFGAAEGRLNYLAVTLP